MTFPPDARIMRGKNVGMLRRSAHGTASQVHARPDGPYSIPSRTGCHGKQEKLGK